MTIGITGATGQLGSLILTHLAAATDAGDLVAIARDPVKAAALQQGAGVRVADYDDEAALAVAFSGIDTLVFVSSSDLVHRLEHHQHVVAAAKSAGVGRVVYTSLLRATESTNPLAPDHVATEQLIRESGIPFVFLRNGWYSENYLGAAVEAAATGVYTTGTGAGRVSSAARDDFARAAVKVALDSDDVESIYELGGDESWSADDFVATVAELSGKPVRVVIPPVDADRDGFVAALDAAISIGDLDAQGSTALHDLIGGPTTRLSETLRAAF